MVDETRLLIPDTLFQMGLLKGIKGCGAVLLRAVSAQSRRHGLLGVPCGHEGSLNSHVQLGKPQSQWNKYGAFGRNADMFV